jgi:hypothetical protein
MLKILNVRWFRCVLQLVAPDVRTWTNKEQALISFTAAVNAGVQYKIELG